MKYLRDIWTAILFGFSFLYEDCKLYKFNPCDIGSFGFLAPLGRSFEIMASPCRCCSGSRMVIFALALAIFPEESSLLLSGVLTGFVVSALYQYYRSYRAKAWRFEQEA